MMTPTIDVNGIPFVPRDLKRELTGRLLLRALAAINILARNESIRALIATNRATAADIVNLISIAPEVLGSDEFKDLVAVLFVPQDATSEAYTKLTPTEQRDLALDIPLFAAWEAIKSFFGSTKSAEGSTPLTSAETP